jgi:HSP20 family molecular chaperone IbpA
MLFTRFNPFSASPLEQRLRIQNEMNRLLNLWGGDAPVSFPAVNIRDQDDALNVEAELPGMNLQDLEIFVTGNSQLTLKGERKPIASRQRNPAPPRTPLRKIRPSLDFALPHRRHQGRGAVGKRHPENPPAQTRSRSAAQNCR